jgi:hypothetical protein
MADIAEDSAGSAAEPLDLVRLSLAEIVFVKLRGDRELKGRLHVRLFPRHALVRFSNSRRLTTVIAIWYLAMSRKRSTQ